MAALALEAATIDALFTHARDEWPRECCGVIIGRHGVPAGHRYHRLENLQDRLHAEDPERFPRDARHAYAIDPLALERLVDAAQARGEDLVAIVHSHPQYPSYFSATDRSAAAPFGFPTYPQAWQLVVSVFDREVRDVKAFRWDEGTEDWHEATIDGAPRLPGPPAGAREFEE